MASELFRKEGVPPSNLLKGESSLVTTLYIYYMNIHPLGCISFKKLRIIDLKNPNCLKFDKQRHSVHLAKIDLWGTKNATKKVLPTL